MSRFPQLNCLTLYFARALLKNAFNVIFTECILAGLRAVNGTGAVVHVY